MRARCRSTVKCEPYRTPGPVTALSGQSPMVSELSTDRLPGSQLGGSVRGRAAAHRDKMAQRRPSFRTRSKQSHCFSSGELKSVYYLLVMTFELNGHSQTSSRHAEYYPTLNWFGLSFPRLCLNQPPKKPNTSLCCSV